MSSVSHRSQEQQKSKQGCCFRQGSRVGGNVSWWHSNTAAKQSPQVLEDTFNPCSWSVLPSLPPPCVAELHSSRLQTHSPQEKVRGQLAPFPGVLVYQELSLAVATGIAPSSPPSHENSPHHLVSDFISDILMNSKLPGWHASFPRHRNTKPGSANKASELLCTRFIHPHEILSSLGFLYLGSLVTLCSFPLKLQLPGFLTQHKGGFLA